MTFRKQTIEGVRCPEDRAQIKADLTEQYNKALAAIDAGTLEGLAFTFQHVEPDILDDDGHPKSRVNGLLQGDTGTLRDILKDQLLHLLKCVVTDGDLTEEN